MMLYDAQAYLVACFQYLYLAANNTLRFFLSVIKDKRERQIIVVMLATFVFRLVIFDRGFLLNLQY